jgi:hypothetical protein
MPRCHIDRLIQAWIAEIPEHQTGALIRGKNETVAPMIGLPPG